ncbi:uncharacterized protein LOC135952138 [Calliphora vicina]|uniref:uncharacterized protein LOC135952138 n=1 Tax=Calliphora vicina TaxID=7373 RepID=UPI00325AE2CE
MKLLYTVIILCLIQLFAIKPLAASVSSNETSVKRMLLEFCRNELKVISLDFCEKAKIFTRKILQDDRVQKAATPKMREFKQNLIDFLHDYPSYKRYGLINELVLLFEEKFDEPSNDNDSQYIWDLLYRQGFDELDIDYESKYDKFVKQKFLPKFEDLKSHWNQDELKQHDNLIQWYNELKECQDYGCQSRHFNTLVREDNTPYEQLFEYIREQLHYIDIFYGNNAHDISNKILKDINLSQLSPDIRQHLIINIREFIMQFESNQDLYELLNLIKFFFNNILQQFYYNTDDFTVQQHKLIVKIFNDNGFAKFLSNYYMLFNDFMEQGLFKNFDEFRNALSPEELASDKSLIECFDKLKALSSSDERYDDFGTCFALLQSKFNEIK